MARASHGVSGGGCFVEIEILPHQGNTRLGWSTDEGDLQAPVGYDHHSYSYRDKDGGAFHQSRVKSYGRPYGPGDIVGMYIHLPRGVKSNTYITLLTPKPPGMTAKLLPVKAVPGSFIEFFVNGASQGRVFEGAIGQGTYYAAASCYHGAEVKFYFGPAFRYPPPPDYKYLPASRLPSLVPSITRKRKKAQEEAEAKLEAMAEPEDGGEGGGLENEIEEEQQEEEEQEEEEEEEEARDDSDYETRREAAPKKPQHRGRRPPPQRTRSRQEEEDDELMDVEMESDDELPPMPPM
eukprot:TRINITY_DN4163_c0_g1_i1.p1 TRINITY_DN4163_c0_g1~~TRINITY_DN4163_c0_g1_i1.p1  ORF type:complete len:293 (-),score=85.23 TRINITY_DN4163_c0_g1_i1:819-1697(-)